MKPLLSLLLFLSVGTVEVVSQPTSGSEKALPDPKVAFLRSMAVPGWGHHFVNQSNWTRGQYHLGAEIVLVLSYVGFSIHSNNLQQNWHTYGRSEAGVTIKDRNREFQLAVGDFNSLEEYNDYQLRSRNWDRLFEDTPENRWRWSGDAARVEYNNLRNRFERIDQQLPALLGMMMVNRLISGISAYNRAKKRAESKSFTSSVYLSQHQFAGGMVANIKIRF